MARQIKRKNLVEGKIYVSLRHDYASFYRIVNDEIQFLDSEKSKPKWFGTIIDESKHTFKEITELDMLIKLKEVKAYDSKKNK